MSDGRKNNGGTKGNKGGRPAKADEQLLLDRLSPYDDLALKVLSEQMKANEPWAIKLFFSYRYGMPKIRAEIEGGGGFILPILNNDPLNGSNNDSPKED